MTLIPGRLRVRVGPHARAFVPTPRSPLMRLALYLRGWRPIDSRFVLMHAGMWWHKPGPRQRRLEEQFTQWDKSK